MYGVMGLFVNLRSSEKRWVAIAGAVKGVVLRCSPGNEAGWQLNSLRSWVKLLMYEGCGN